MSLWDRLFGKSLCLEGTRFPVFVKELVYFERCKTTGQAGLLFPFNEYFPVNKRGFERKAIDGRTRLLCGGCLMDMPMAFQFSLPGSPLPGGIIAFGGNPTRENVFTAAQATRCPHCGDTRGLLLWDHPNYGEITEQDMDALRQLWRFRCQVWWKADARMEAKCDRCSQALSREEGYHSGARVVCVQCVDDSLSAAALSELQKNPDYYGASELRRARNFLAGAWKLESGYWA